MKKVVKTSILPLTIIVAAFVFVNLLLRWIYAADNKYTSSAPRGAGGAIHLSRIDLEERLAVPLIDGWEYYPGALYEPEDFQTGTAVGAREIFVGEISGFSSGADRSPFGAATYRLSVHTDPSLPALSMELPEIFSASAVWVNGRLAAANGRPDARDYRAHVQSRVIPVPSGDAEIVVQAANYTHYYSGMTYPPMLGLPDNLNRMLLFRIGFYGFLCFFSLGAAAASCFLWLSSKRPLYRLYGLLALFFALQVSYPFVHWLGVEPVRLTYVVEDAARFALILCMIALTGRLCARAIPTALQKGFFIAGLLFCALPALCQFFLFPALPQAIPVYGAVLHAGKAVLSLYLLVSALLGCLRGGASAWLLAGNAVFAAGVLSDFLTANRFEPICFGWQDEYGGFLMVLLFTGLMASYGRRLLRENEKLTAHLQEEVADKTRHLTALLDERKRFLSSVAHDLKAPVAVIKTYTEYIRQGNVQVDGEVGEYLDLIERKSGQLENSLSGLQLFNLESSAGEKEAVVDLHAFLENAYWETRPYADANGIYYHLDLPRGPARIRCQPTRFYRTLENIVLNATAYTPPDGTITMKLTYEDRHAVLRISDTGAGIPPDNLSRVFDYRFSTSGDTAEARGLGLYFARVTVEEMGGTIAVSSTLGKGAAFILRLPLEQEKTSD